MADAKATLVLLEMSQDSYAANIVTTCDHSNVTRLEFNEILDFTGFKIILDCVFLADIWVWVSNGTSIMRYNIWNLVLSENSLVDTEELPASVFLINTCKLESTFDVVGETEVITGRLNCDNVLESDWESRVCTGFAVNLN